MTTASEGSVRPLPRPSFYAGIVALAVFSLVGAGAIVAGVVPGHAAAVTPWGILISTYVFFALSSTGLCLVSSLGHVFHVKAFQPIARRAIFLAIITLLIAFSVMAMELARPMRLGRGAIISANPTSPIWWMGMLYGISLASKLAEFFLMCAVDMAKEARSRTGIAHWVFRALALGSLDISKARVRRTARWSASAGLTGLVASVAAPSTLGAVFGFISSKPLWYGPYMPIYFLLTALLSGAALLPFVVYATYVLRRLELTPVRELLQASGKLLAGILGVFLFFTVWKTITALYGQTPDNYDSTMELVRGRLMGQFWVFEILLGVGIPLAILLSRKLRTSLGVGLASLLVMVGVFVARYDFVVTGQLSVPGEGRLFEGPNPEESLIVCVAFSLCMLLYMAGERLLPISERHHMLAHAVAHSESEPGEGTGDSPAQRELREQRA